MRYRVMIFPARPGGVPSVPGRSRIDNYVRLRIQISTLTGVFLLGLLFHPMVGSV